MTEFLDAIYKGTLIRDANLRAEGRNRMQPFIEPALRGDTGALASVFQHSPDTGARIAQVVSSLDANKRRALGEYTDFITRDGLGILQAPAAARPQLYAQTLEMARQRGYDVSGMPPEYSPDAEAKLKFYVQRATPFATALKRMGGGGGGPAPAGGDMWGPAGGGAPAPRVSAAPTDQPEPTVASLPQPAMPQPAMAPAPGGTGGAAPPGPSPTMAGAGPMPGVLPPAAPQAPAGPFAAPSGPMLAQAAPQPSAAPAAPTGAPAPAPTQMAGGPALSEDMTYEKGADGDRLVVTDGGQQRIISLPPGYRPAYFDKKTGKPERDGDDMYLIPVDAQGRRTGPAVIWRMPPKRDPQQRQPPAGFEPDPDNPNRLRPQPGGPQDAEFIRSQPKPAPAGYEPNPAGTTPTAVRPIEGGPATDKLRQFDASVRDVFSAADRFLTVFEQQGGASINAYLNNSRDPQAQQLLTAYNNMIMSLRGEGFANTGVLQPAEIAMLRDQFLSPESIRGAMASPEAMRAKIDELKLYIQNKREAHFSAAGVPVPAFGGGAQSAPAPSADQGSLAQGGRAPSVSVGMPGAGAPPLTLLKEGVETTFKNGQTWTVRNGKQERVR